MTIKGFMENNNIKSPKKVYNWIEKGFIPGTVQDSETNEYIIPNHAKVPSQKLSDALVEAFKGKLKE